MRQKAVEDELEVQAVIDAVVGAEGTSACGEDHILLRNEGLHAKILRMQSGSSGRLALHRNMSRLLNTKSC